MTRYDIHLKDPTTNEIIIYEDGFEWDDMLDENGIGFTAPAWVTYMYTEGNYSCDCNRSMFMDIDDLPCGDTIELVKIVEHGTDNVVWPEPPTVGEKYPVLVKLNFKFVV